MKFVISPQGNFEQAEIAETTLKHKEIEDCIAKRFRTWEFPKPKDGKAVTATSSITFKTAP